MKKTIEKKSTIKTPEKMQSMLFLDEIKEEGLSEGKKPISMGNLFEDKNAKKTIKTKNMKNPIEKIEKTILEKTPIPLKLSMEKKNQNSSKEDEKTIHIKKSQHSIEYESSSGGEEKAQISKKNSVFSIENSMAEDYDSQPIQKKTQPNKYLEEMQSMYYLPDQKDKYLKGKKPTSTKHLSIENKKEFNINEKDEISDSDCEISKLSQYSKEAKTKLLKKLIKNNEQIRENISEYKHFFIDLRHHPWKMQNHPSIEETFDIKTRLKIIKQEDILMYPKEICEEIEKLIAEKLDNLCGKFYENEENIHYIEKNLMDDKKEEPAIVLKKELKNLLKDSEQMKESSAECQKLLNNLEFKSENNILVQEIFQKYGDLESYAKEITKPLPNDMYKITSEDGIGQFLVEENENDINENKFNTYLSEKNIEKESHIYNYTDKNVGKLMERTRYLWENLKISEEITMKNINFILQKMYEDLSSLKEIYQIDIVSNLKSYISNKCTIENIIKMILYDYTTGSYVNINKALSTKDPIQLSKLGYYINLIAVNNKNPIIGKPFFGCKGRKVYRNIWLKRELLSFYQKGELLFFSNLTSTSLSHIFKSPATTTHINVEFEIELLGLKELQSLKFFSGLYIDDISACKGEQEVILTPYQIFRINEIKATNTECIIQLEEVYDKALIKEIMTPRPMQKQNIKKITENDLKKGLNFLKKEKNNLDVKLQENEEKKKKLENVMKLKMETIIKTEIEDFFSLPNQNFDFFENFGKFVEKFKNTYSVKVFDEFAFYDYIASRSLALNNKIDNSKRIATGLDLLKKHKNYFKDLQIEHIFNDQILDFLFIILKELFKNINQNIYFCEKMNSKLIKNYYQRLTIGNLNNNLMKIVIKNKKNSFNSIDFHENGYYVKSIFSGLETHENFAIYFETNLSTENFIQRLTINNKTIELIDYKQMNRFNELLFNPSLFAVAGNKDYIINQYPPEERGNMVYNFPNGYKRFGLFVEKGPWLTMDNSPGEWPVAFTSVRDLIFDNSVFGKPNMNYLNKANYPYILKNGVQCVNDVRLVEQVLNEIELMGKKFKVCFQCRVNPKEIQFVSENSQIYVLDRTKNDIIKPYGILIKEIK